MLYFRKNLILFYEIKKVIGFVKSTLGPRGMDKLLISKKGDIKITNDGATILKNAFYNNIVKKIFDNLINTYDNEIGDGTTSVSCLIGELVSEAEKLIGIQIHPQIIIKGYKLAAREALSILNSIMFSENKNEKLFCEHLFDLAKTTLCSKIVFPVRDHFAKLLVEAVLKLNGNIDIRYIKIIKKIGGSIRDSFLEEGFILESKMGVGQPKRIENAKILIANTALDSDKIKIYGTKIKTFTLANLARIEIADQKKILDKCKKIIFHGANVFVNRQLIYNKQESFLTNYGIVSIEHADFEGIERLSLVTGGEIVSTFDEPSKIKLGYCKIVEEIMVNREKMVRFNGKLKINACTLVIRGSTQQLLDEVERSVHDALCVLSRSIRDPRFVWGGGNTDIFLFLKLENFSQKFKSKVSMAILAFSRSIRNLVKILLENAEVDSTFLISQLKTACQKGNAKACIDIKKKNVAQADKLGLIELFKLKTQMIISAVETVEMILRIDTILK
ncbi:t-complex protein 1 beta SU (nucleomorph) [Cryptomonas paramecium]|uniref:CCT-beta n=1 Tax=Cryptomonas paramaecium TaxID=2898 RepID=F2HHS5_9CRYP|nr:t-complex protein 1 beta SU [Cryptomonas paramecium]AEA38871.1 t-complex protein 1 beta SU [Cryptomonas paramecium]|mmetsp:Transcript_36629/g.96485  ORF Transcript_36629/g.96485 Transcript_36629/m.96485 type:complete len:503 (+) Transcript_36629:3298-4806(+)